MSDARSQRTMIVRIDDPDARPPMATALPAPWTDDVRPTTSHAGEIGKRLRIAAGRQAIDVADALRLDWVRQ
jgi:hypothetical protein